MKNLNIARKRLRSLILPETNSEFTPENQWLEEEIAIWDGHAFA